MRHSVNVSRLGGARRAAAAAADFWRTVAVPKDDYPSAARPTVSRRWAFAEATKSRPREPAKAEQTRLALVLRPIYHRVGLAGLRRRRHWLIAHDGHLSPRRVVPRLARVRCRHAGLKGWNLCHMASFVNRKDPRGTRAHRAAAQRLKLTSSRSACSRVISGAALLSAAKTAGASRRVRDDHVGSSRTPPLGRISLW